MTRPNGSLINLGYDGAGRQQTAALPSGQLQRSYDTHKGTERIEPWTAHYDQFGRLIARTDYNAVNIAGAYAFFAWKISAAEDGKE